MIDLLLMRNLTQSSANPSLVEIRAAVEDIFAARAAEAQANDELARTWPARLTAHPHWESSFARASDSAGLTIALADAVAEVNAWLDLIEHARLAE